jgi:hypothetical protein
VLSYSLFRLISEVLGVTEVNHVSPLGYSGQWSEGGSDICTLPFPALARETSLVTLSPLCFCSLSISSRMRISWRTWGPWVPIEPLHQRFQTHQSMNLDGKGIASLFPLTF